ncbi:hypothetical protein CANCADRAFT_93746 [Tortispora caseinolytica NRRL Y-17796]|uniref:Uncharacterized protein n=1 Tax=Tortispora caseinolytica NRRL Y-17796 TaxID=767744 RepID=A0A1E4TMG8_9ASCO|nr:hypothetical protein CANCADRAFT_93746 [Tortispora caseinolytica NRRL Y-17796]
MNTLATSMNIMLHAPVLGCTQSKLDRQHLIASMLHDRSPKKKLKRSKKHSKPPSYSNRRLTRCDTVQQTHSAGVNALAELPYADYNVVRELTKGRAQELARRNNLRQLPYMYVEFSASDFENRILMKQLPYYGCHMDHIVHDNKANDGLPYYRQDFAADFDVDRVNARDNLRSIHALPFKDCDIALEFGHDGHTVQNRSWLKLLPYFRSNWDPVVYENKMNDGLPFYMRDFASEFAADSKDSSSKAYMFKYLPFHCCNLALEQKITAEKFKEKDRLDSLSKGALIRRELLCVDNTNMSLKLLKELPFHPSWESATENIRSVKEPRLLMDGKKGHLVSQLATQKNLTAVPFYHKKIDCPTKGQQNERKPRKREPRKCKPRKYKPRKCKRNTN